MTNGGHRLAGSAGGRAAELILSQAYGAVRPALAEAVGRLSPLSRQIAEYHLGWTEADGRPTDGRGKAVRPALAFLGAQAAGQPAHRAVPGAVAIELVHNFSLLQDDVMDGDVERRHRPAAWTVFGVNPVLCASDALLTLAAQVLSEQPGAGARQALIELLRATQDMVAGQSVDVSGVGGAATSYAQYLALAEAKTGALLGGAAAVGALLAGADQALVADLGRFGRALGVLYQVVDDILDVWGATRTTGRPRGSDLRAQKPSLPVLYGLALDGGLLDHGAAETIARLDAAGVYRRVLAEAERHHGLALASLGTTAIPVTVRDDLAELATYVLARAFRVEGTPIPGTHPGGTTQQTGAVH